MVLSFYIRILIKLVLCPKITYILFLMLGMFNYSQVVINEVMQIIPEVMLKEFIELKSSTPNFPLMVMYSFF